MKVARSRVGEPADMVLLATRLLAVIVAPVLVAAFIMLYLFPEDTGRLFAWPIGPRMSAMMLGATYIGGAYFFVRVLLARYWHSIKLGLLPVSAFAGVLGITTALHWDRFTHGHISFILWAILYFSLPFIIPLVWFVNQRINARPNAGIEPRMPVWLVVPYAALGGVLTIASALLLVMPQAMIDIWPWTLSPLTSRVMAAMFVLAGLVAIAIAVDRHWSAARIPLQAQAISIALFLLAMAIARDNLAWGQIGSWLFLGGMLFVLALIAATSLWARGSQQPEWSGGAGPARAE